MSIFSKLRGTSETIFQIGLGGPNLKKVGVNFEAKNAADDGFVTLSGAEPTVGDHFATKTYVDGVVAGVDIVSAIKFATALATVASTATIPISSRVISCLFDVTTAYDAGATWSIGDTDTVTRYQVTADNDPATIGQYETTEHVDSHSAAIEVTATLVGTPTVGAGSVLVRYVETPAA